MTWVSDEGDVEIQMSLATKDPLASENRKCTITSKSLKEYIEDPQKYFYRCS